MLLELITWYVFYSLIYDEFGNDEIYPSDGDTACQRTYPFFKPPRWACSRNCDRSPVLINDLRIDRLHADETEEPNDRR